MKTALAILCCFAVTAAAAPADEITTRVADVVERYAGAVACPGVKVAPGDVLALAPEQSGETAPMFAVLWSGDLGCHGGSGTFRTNLAIATINSGRVVVQPALSSPVAAFDSPVRVVSRVVGHGADVLVLEGKEYGPGDPNSNPSVPVRFTLKLNAKGNWRLADKVRLVGVERLP